MASEAQLADVSAGEWRVTWWDTIAGQPAPSTVVKHPGSLLKLATTAIDRHAAVVLTR